MKQLRIGTVSLGLDLVAAGVKCCKIRQLHASEARETVRSKAAQNNTPTMPAYSKTKLQSFQASDSWRVLEQTMQTYPIRINKVI